MQVWIRRMQLACRCMHTSEGVVMGTKRRSPQGRPPCVSRSGGSIAAALMATLAGISVHAASVKRGAGDPLSTAMLFFDLSHWVNESEGVCVGVGDPVLLSTFHDPTSYVGWAYPSVWRECDAPGCGYRMMYQGWHLRDGKEDTKLMLLAESQDGVSWTPRNVSTANCPAPNCVLNDGNNEFGVVYDDGKHSPPEERLKALWSNATLSVSADGLSWRSFGRWTSKSIDPGISVFRNPLNPEEVVVTSRPQSLRPHGRHAGFHSGLGWASLAAEENQPILPLDELYEDTDQFYGLPSFAYGGMYVVSHVWRYRCSNPPCYKGGFVSSALAVSYNSHNWTAVGQHSTAASSGTRDLRASNPVVPRGPINNTDLYNGQPAYSHTYRHFANTTEGALACQHECDGDTKCAAWTYVVNNTGNGPERCCRHASLGCPLECMGCISGARTAEACVGPSPPPPSPPPPPTVPLPELFPNVNGTATAGQVYPSTLVDLPDQGRVLVHASASTHQHGFVSQEPGTWSSILTYELRRDGFTFVSLSSADGAPGTLVTKPFQWIAGELSLNADCAPSAAAQGGRSYDLTSGGSIRVAVLHTDGTEVPGYGMGDADVFTGNATAHIVTWRGQPRMTALAGTMVRVSVQITGSAKLYSFRGNFSGPIA